MTEFKITFNTENAAFDDDLQDGSVDNSEAEVNRILNVIRHQVLSGLNQGLIWDINGNTIGDWVWQ
mgnify:CR=1 FL=1